VFDAEPVAVFVEDLEVEVTRDEVWVLALFDDVDLACAVVVCFAMEEVKAGVKKVLVLSIPVTPMIVWALPSGIGNVPFLL
jgi:hypothetical protein